MVGRVGGGVDQADTIDQDAHPVGAEPPPDHRTAGSRTEIGRRDTGLVRDRVGQRAGQIVLEVAPVDHFHTADNLIGCHAERLGGDDDDIGIRLVAVGMRLGSCRRRSQQTEHEQRAGGGKKVTHGIPAT